MPIDANIPLGVKPVQIESPMNMLAQAMQIQGAQNQNALAQYSLNKAQRSDQETHALAQLLQGGGIDLSTPEGQARAFQTAPTVAPGMIKSYLEGRELTSKIGKNNADAKLNDSKVMDAALQRSRDMLAGVQTPEQYLQWHQANHADPVIGPMLAARGITPEQSMQKIQQALQTPGGFQQLLQQSALGMQKFMELNKPTTHVVNTGGTTQMVQVPGLGGAPQVTGTMQNTQSPDNAATNATSRANNAATVGATIRGQNLTDARARESNAQGKTQLVETPQGYMLVDKNTGQSRPATAADGKPLQGKANDRVMTDSQAKANLFGTRMKESDRILSELDGKYSPGAVNARSAAADIPVVGGITGYAANVAASPQTQQAEQAQRDFINAVLRRESGAAISAGEFTNAKQQYFPQPGDSPQVKAQKARNRKLAIAGMEAEVPGGFRMPPSLTSPAGNTGGATGSFGDGPQPRVIDFGSLR